MLVSLFLSFNAPGHLPTKLAARSFVYVNYCFLFLARALFSSRPSINYPLSRSIRTPMASFNFIIHSVIILNLQVGDGVRAVALDEDVAHQARALGTQGVQVCVVSDHKRRATGGSAFCACGSRGWGGGGGGGEKKKKKKNFLKKKKKKRTRGEDS